MAGSSLPGAFWIWVAADQAITLLVDVVVLTGRESETVDGDLVAAPALRTTTPLILPRPTIGRVEMEDSASPMRAYNTCVVNYEVGATETRHRVTDRYYIRTWRTTG
ncbi:hypothetical protein BDP55DRAFT_637143 [Colletotrichum godetiae]|uniref:Secreted protein n=1 Tax=Colletotrichum godetiae TaxID=1209918 RepID=A0AAJ0A9Y9_9PEZI|nr:uncharacterized protein BDP55DRAFT_637143 [Colletotrichum godetiae]KAK1659271.1 hypothetical protein BDP55DRAFT_637143 [Colletotrichum godetiae]